MEILEAEREQVVLESEHMLSEIGNTEHQALTKGTGLSKLKCQTYYRADTQLLLDPFPPLCSLWSSFKIRFFRALIFLTLVVFFADIVDSIEKENIILKKKNLELQEQIEILEKAVKTLSEEKQRGKQDEEEKGKVALENSL